MQVHYRTQVEYFKANWLIVRVVTVERQRPPYGADHLQEQPSAMPVDSIWRREMHLGRQTRKERMPVYWRALAIGRVHHQLWIQSFRIQGNKWVHPTEYKNIHQGLALEEAIVTGQAVQKAVVDVQPSTIE